MLVTPVSYTLAVGAAEGTTTGVPAGTYRLRVWHEQLGTISRRVRIPEGGTAVVVLHYP